MSWLLEQMEALRTRIREHLTDDADFCTDKAEITTVLGEGKLAVYLSPPEVEFQTWNQTNAEFDLWIIHPDQTDEQTSLAEIFALANELELPDNWAFVKASPAMWPTGHPAYRLRIN